MNQKKEIIAETGMSEGSLNFEISESGTYTIWCKRIEQIGFTTLGINNYQYKLINAKDNNKIELKELWDPEEFKEKRNKAPLFSNRWYLLYSFEAPPGHYRLEFEEHNHYQAPLEMFKPLGFLNPFRLINPKKYNVVITAHEPLQSNVIKVLLVVFYLLTTLISCFTLIYFIQSK